LILNPERRIRPILETDDGLLIVADQDAGPDQGGAISNDGKSVRRWTWVGGCRLDWSFLLS